MMRHKITQVKYLLSNKIQELKYTIQLQVYKTKLLFKRIWFKIALLLIIALVFTQKDFSFQINLNSGQQLAASNLHSPASIVNKNKKKLTSNKEDLAPEIKTVGVANTKNNLANTFSNLAFVLNPSYAKRKNIPNKIVLQKREVCKKYIKRFAKTAITEMDKYGIPASITLAQGLLESNAGDSRLAKKNSNHFGIKCFSRSCKKGHCSNFTDDTHKDFFKQYKSAWESYRAHSALLQNKRYLPLKAYSKTDYKNWAYGLKKCGYATDKKYAQKLIRIIETLKLSQYDKQKSITS